MRRSSFAVVAAIVLAIVVSFTVSSSTVERQIIGQLVWTTGTTAPSATQVPAPSTGSLYTRTDTGQVYIYNGSAWITYGALGTAQGLKVAVGTITLDGTNPSSATTGLAAITGCAIVDKRSDTPGDDPSFFTTITAASAGRLDVYAWKNTSGTDPTLVASTDADDLVDYVCIGT
ncbi:MAG: hypothetical protein Q8T13_04940 [Acidobacteriota bacterium]|nr:hypothetical protein [Acidobacteriota bacterium]